MLTSAPTLDIRLFGPPHRDGVPLPRTIAALLGDKRESVRGRRRIVPSPSRDPR